MSKRYGVGLVVSLVVLSGCRGDGMRTHTVAMEMCVANIPVYAPGQLPPVPYRMIAPVDSRWGISVTSRFEHMKARACALGADAIIDTPDRYVSTSSYTTTMQYDAAGRPVLIQEQAQNPAWRNTPIAIKFLGPMAQQVTVLQSPPPQVTFVQTPPAQVMVVQAPPTVVLPTE
jgi:hypothetical protein